MFIVVLSLGLGVQECAPAGGAPLFIGRGESNGGVKHVRTCSVAWDSTARL